MKNEIVSRWAKNALELMDSDELLRLLLEQCDKKQKAYLMEAMQSELRYENVYCIECKTLDDSYKFEAFISEFKPYYNEQSLFF